MSLNPNRDFKDQIQVPTIALSSFIGGSIGDDEIDYLKLDIEGAEPGVMREMSNAGCLRKVRELFIEYHHRIANAPSCMSELLQILEHNDFEYYIDTFYTSRHQPDKFQNLNIFASKKDNSA